MVVHNLPESEGSTPKDKIEKDIELFKEMVKDSFHLNVAVSRGFRVGKIADGKDRLMTD